MKQVTFKYFMNLQARFLNFKAYQLKVSELEVASIFAEYLRSKIEQKYTIIF
ncbi:MAG: hypothetical protein KKF62_18205 [Bacteroidetes bacterium]|nr:hypothetical protein [Bacteroidota bacterium]MBU1115070.1 hypothetical protein [Bacteroidota bacterium]MBU1797172.1 hypothetical protein [Bacteroidota bacterium]